MLLQSLCQLFWYWGCSQWSFILGSQIGVVVRKQQFRIGKSPVTGHFSSTTCGMRGVISFCCWELVSSKHYQAAEKAHTANNDAEAHKELDAASKALS